MQKKITAKKKKCRIGKIGFRDAEIRHISALELFFSDLVSAFPHS